MLTIFTIPKSFQGKIRIIQRNAVRSWTALEPSCEIILFGNDEGISGAAEELGVRHISEIPLNAFGTPLISSAFETARVRARNDILAYVNADIILMQDFTEAIRKIELSPFLMIGRRWDLDLDRELNISNRYWQSELKDMVRIEGKLHGLSGIDYFVFPRNLKHDLPPFAVGRPGWDNWLIHHALTKEIPVIDATACLTAVHQNHESVYQARKKEVEENIQIGGLHSMSTLRDADWVLDAGGLRRSPYHRRLFSRFSLSRPGSRLLFLKRKAQNLFAYR